MFVHKSLDLFHIPMLMIGIQKGFQFPSVLFQILLDLIEHLRFEFLLIIPQYLPKYAFHYGGLLAQFKERRFAVFGFALVLQNVPAHFHQFIEFLDGKRDSGQSYW